MTSTESPFSLTVKTARGDLLTARGNDIEQFRSNVESALALRVELDRGEVGQFGQAEAVVRREFPGTSTVGQAPQANGGTGGTQYSPAGTGQLVQSPPPDTNYPGDCKHGPRTFKNTKARGTDWLRWECALDWRKGDNAHNAQRCKAINL